MIKEFRNEDWMAVGLGFFMIAIVLLGFKPSLPKFKWVTDREFATIVAEARPKADQFIQETQVRGDTEMLASATRLQEAIASGNRQAIQSAAREILDKDKKNDLAAKLSEQAGAYPARVFSAQNIQRSITIGAIFGLLSALGIWLMGGRVGAFIIGFPLIYVLTWLAQLIAGNVTVSYWGLEYVIWALLLGLLISNLIGIPDWLQEAVRTEYYIKTGLVILGAGILFGEILQAGALGIIQAVLVVFVVWYTAFWLSKRLRVDDEFAVMLSTAVSICGVSAAIAACGAIRGDKKKLSYVTSLVLIVAVPMMVLMPWMIKAFGIPEVVGGAWLGGTLDTSGSVVAAGALVSEPAMKTGVIVKFSQNVLIGVVAFLLAVWWTMQKETQAGQRPSPKIIWERFPKFVLGFLVTSIFFSFIIDPVLVKETKGDLTGLRTVWFALAFTSIGLETRLTELVRMGEGRPAMAFLGAQAVNVLWTLILAYLLFGGILLPPPSMG